MRVRQRPAIHVQRLRGLVMRIGGAHVEAAQLEIRPQHSLDAFQYLRRLDHFLKELALIDHVGKAARAGFRLELASGLIAFFGEKLFDTREGLPEFLMSSYCRTGRRTVPPNGFGTSAMTGWILSAYAWMSAP